MSWLNSKKRLILLRGQPILSVSSDIPTDYPLYPYDIPGLDFSVGSRVTSYTSPIPDGDANNTRPSGVPYAALPAWASYSSALGRVLINNQSDKTVTGIDFSNLYLEITGTSSNITVEDCKFNQTVATIIGGHQLACIRINASTTGTVVQYNTIDGGSVDPGAPPTGYTVNSGVYSYGPVTVYRNKFKGLHGDCVGVVAGPTLISQNWMYDLNYAATYGLHGDIISIQYQTDTDLIHVDNNLLDMFNPGPAGGGGCIRATGQGNIPSPLTTPITNVRITRNLAKNNSTSATFHIEGYGNNPAHNYDATPAGTFTQYATGVFMLDNWYILEGGIATLLYPDRTDDLVFNNQYILNTGTASGTSVGFHRRHSTNASDYRYYSNGHLRRFA